MHVNIKLFRYFQKAQRPWHRRGDHAQTPEASEQIAHDQREAGSCIPEDKVR